MQLGKPGEDLIKKWEGFRPTAYLDTGRVWTIGWGHTHNVHQGDTCTYAQAQAWFLEDTAEAIAVVNDHVTVAVTQNQFDALASFAFNEGPSQFVGSGLLRKLNAGDYAGAAAEFPKWKYDNGKVIDGLVNRRADEQELFNTPDEPPPPVAKAA